MSRLERDDHENLQPFDAEAAWKELPHELLAVEAELRLIPLSTGKLDRERLMFQLGRESAQREAVPSESEPSTPQASNARSVLAASSRWWPASAAALLLLSVGLASAMIARPERIVVVERLVVANEPTSRQATLPVESRDPAAPRDVGEVPVWRGGQYLAQRQIAVMQSLEAPPARLNGRSNAEPAEHEPSPPLTARELWKTWSEENQTPQPTPASEPAWLQWLNLETWL